MKTKLFAAFLAALVALALPGAAGATNGMQVIGHGPVVRSMGGATVGLPLDASAVLTNPAGMSQLGGRIDFGVTYFVPSSEYRAVDLTPFGGGNTGTLSSDTGASPMPAFGLIVPINKQLNFGLGAYGIAGMGVDYPSALYGNVTYTSFQMMKFAPGLSYKINNIFSVGAALNLDYATLNFDAGRSQTTGAIVAHDSNSQFGYGFQFGLLVKPVSWFQVGLAYVSRQTFGDFTFNTPYGEDRMDLDLPQNVVLGLGFMPTARLKIAADLKWINWKSTMGENKPAWNKNSSGSGAWNTNWDDQWVFAIGAEYALTNWVRLRAGFNYAKNPLPSSRAFEAIAFPAIVESHYTLGVGFTLNPNLELNLGAMYAPKVSMTGANLAQQGIQSYTTSLSEWSAEFGLAYKW